MDPRGVPSSNEGGQTLPLIVVFVLSLMIVCGMVIDIGNAYRVHQQLQASADAAAAAGAGNLPSTTAAINAANAFSSGTGGRNPIVGAGTVSVSASVDCSSSPDFCGTGNTVHVTQNASVPTTFLRVIGIDTIPETVRAQACSPCGGLPLDVMIVLDRSGSMSRTKLVFPPRTASEAFLGSMDPSQGTTSAWPCCRRPPIPAAPCAASASEQLQPAPNAAYLLVPLTATTYAVLERATSTRVPRYSRRSAACRPAGRPRMRAPWTRPRRRSPPDGRPGHPEGDRHPLGRRRQLRPELPPPIPRPTGRVPCEAGGQQSPPRVRPTRVLMYSIAYDISGAGADPCYAAQGAIVERPYRRDRATRPSSRRSSQTRRYSRSRAPETTTPSRNQRS